MSDILLEATDAVRERELAEILLSERGSEFNAFPLSFAQQRLWFIDQLQPGGAAYNIPLTLRLRGRLDVVALERGLAAIVERHEALRTRFARVDGRPIQFVLPEVRVPMVSMDLAPLPAELRDKEARRLAREQASQPFDLSRPPLLRASLLRLDREEHWLLLTVHHIVFDGWSIGIFCRELTAFYEDFAGGRPAQLPELEIQYPDFARWQRDWFQGAPLDEALAWWREQLAGDLPRLELPVDWPRSAGGSGQGERLVVPLPREGLAALRAWALREGATPFMVLTAAFKALLFRYTGQEDLLLGTPIANRNQPEIEPLIGFFVNTLILRTDLSGDPAFAGLVRRVREVALGAYAHEDTPFELIVEALHPDRSAGGPPLFQALFALQNAPMALVTPAGLAIEVLHVDNGTAKFDLQVEAWEQADGITCVAEYDTGMFDRSTIERLLEHFGRLLTGAVADPSLPLSRLPLLSEAEQRQLLEWSGAAPAYPRERSIHSLFDEQVALRPEAVAVECAGDSLTYRELQARANRLAHHLRTIGVAGDSLVALSAERSNDLVVGVLGILKSGGAYVPLDPSHPAERLALFLEETRQGDLPPVIVAQSHLLDRLPLDGARVVPLDAPEILRGEDPGNPEDFAGPESLAYILYTSGSTGRPKGVAVPHRAVVRLVKETDFARFGPEEVFLQFAPLAFDASTLEIYGPLLHGGRLVMVPAGNPSLAELGALIRASGVTTLWLTAALMQQMVDTEIGSLAGVRQLLAGGDVLPVPQVLRVLRELPGTRLINGYGPTENTTFTCCHPMSRLEDVGRTVPIGRPIANTRVYVLDAGLRPVPQGVSGELCVGGDGLARGYHRRPDLTAERFVPHPVSSRPGERLYRTGDRVRWLTGGVIEFQGRFDDQVKVRGFRVEPGEIAVVLLANPAVREAVVLARGSNPGDKRLVAYVVPASDGLSAGDLRTWLRERLPEPMVPSAFVLLEALPLNSSGKVDRRALPEPERERGGEDGYVAPRTPLEEMLAEIWAALLGLDRVGIHDGFFELGGHSLLATQVVSRVREALHLEISLRALFENPTVAGLAAAVEEALRGADVVAPSRIVPVPRDGRALPLSFTQERLWFLHQLNPESHAYNLPAAVRMTGDLDHEALAWSFGEVVRRHEALRTRFPVAGAKAVQIIEPPIPFLLPRVDLSALPAESSEAEGLRLARGLAQEPFKLEVGPLLKAAAVRLGTGRHLLLLSMHHVVADAWSIDVLVRELAALYAARRRGEAAALPELPVQYADYACWQRDWLQGEALESQLGFWKKALGGRLPALDLPTDFPRPAVQDYRGGQRHLAIPPEINARLHGLAGEEGATLFMVLLTSFALLLGRQAEQEDVIVGSPIAGRHRVETEGLIGCFLNSLSLRVDLSGDPPFRKLLRRVREVVLDSYLHQDLPFERLVEELRPERDLGRHPIFDVLLNLVNTPQGELRLPDLTLERVDLPDTESKFAMTLYAREDAGGLALRLVYQSALFSERRMALLLDQLRYLLEQAADHPEAPLSSLSLVAPSSLEVVPDPTLPLEGPAFPPVASMVLEQARLHPGAPAIRHGGEVYTYAELAGRARSVAQFLLSLGLHPGEVVAVEGTRCFQLFATLLGVLAAGGALLALDRRLPAQRRHLMLREARTRFLLRVGEAAGEVPGDLPDLQAVTLAEDFDLPTGGELPVPGPDDPAYVFFTSGTTGIPKGVLGRHNGLSHFLSWQRETFGVGAGDRSAQLTGLSFDVVMRDIFLPLTSGATLCLPADEDLGPERVLPWLEAGGITILHTVPALARTWLSQVPPGVTLSSLRWVFFAGEPLTDGLVARWREAFPDSAEIINLYGPTETTLAKCFFQVPEPPAHGVQPVGRPIPGAQVLVLSGDRLCGVGEPGEIVVRTPYRSLGYLRAEEPGSARFVPNPFLDDPSDLVYRTGDKGRFRPDGELEILGRMDDQVKLRGMRIEPGEIKACLEAHPALREAEVLVRKNAGGEARLVGYYVIAGAEAPTVSELRRFLGERLLDYMIPGAFVRLDAFPLNPSGKVDRARLPEPGADRPELDAPYQAPQSRLERVIAEIWREALKVERIGVADNFFDLGGHSLLMVEIRGKLEPALSREVSLVDLFRHPSVGALARHLTQQPQPDHAPERVGYDRAAVRRQAAARRQGRPAAPVPARTISRRTT